MKDLDKVKSEIYSLRDDLKASKDVVYSLCQIVVDRYCTEDCHNCDVVDICDVLNESESLAS